MRVLAAHGRGEAVRGEGEWGVGVCCRCARIGGASPAAACHWMASSTRESGSEKGIVRARVHAQLNHQRACRRRGVAPVVQKRECRPQLDSTEPRPKTLSLARNVLIFIPQAFVCAPGKRAWRVREGERLAHSLFAHHAPYHPPLRPRRRRRPRQQLDGDARIASPRSPVNNNISLLPRPVQARPGLLHGPGRHARRPVARLERAGSGHPVGGRRVRRNVRRRFLPHPGGRPHHRPPDGGGRAQRHGHQQER